MRLENVPLRCPQRCARRVLRCCVRCGGCLCSLRSKHDKGDLELGLVDWSAGSASSAAPARSPTRRSSFPRLVKRISFGSSPYLSGGEGNGDCSKGDVNVSGFSPEEQAENDDALFTRALHMLEVVRERKEFARGVSDVEEDALSVVGDHQQFSRQASADSSPGAWESSGEPLSPSLSPRSATGFHRGCTGESSLTRGSAASEGDVQERVEIEGMYYNLMRRELPTGEQALRLVQSALRYFREECGPLVRLPAPTGRLIVVGDLHGHFNDFLHVRNSFGPPSKDNQFLFNGDFVDRGVWGPEVLLALFCMKLMYRSYVHLNRGNHESKLCTNVYGFKAHLACAYPDHHQELYEAIHEAFDQLPVSYVIGGSIFVVHGGLPNFPVSLRDIEKLNRGPVPHPGVSRKDHLMQALLWSDPKQISGESDRGMGWHFSPKMTKKFLEHNRLKHIVRSHECIESGYYLTHGGMVTTVFSASNYNQSNNASVVLVDASCSVVRGLAWNEAYVRSEWIDPEVLSQLERPHLGNSGGYVDYAVELQVEQGAHLGVELSLENPGLQLAVVVDMFEGVIADFNATSPEIPIQIGDALVEVNGRGGYDAIVSALTGDACLRILLRRPQQIDLEVPSGANSAVHDFEFPEEGYAFTKLGRTSIIGKHDRIVSVNGKKNGSAMRHEMATAKHVQMKLFRYAPPDLCIATRSERLEMCIRQSCCAEWEDSASHHLAIQALKDRIGDAEKLQESSRDRLLRELRTMIFMNRPRLLEAFQLRDRLDVATAAPGKEVRMQGSVFEDSWAKVMQNTLRTPLDFPWLELRPHLCDITRDGRISYVDFLMRFHNRLSRWLTTQWCDTAFDRLAHKLDDVPSRVFDQLDVEGHGTLSYLDLRPFFLKHLYPHEPCTKDERRCREVQYFALFRQLRRHHADCFITKPEFVQVFARYNPSEAKHCPNGHRLEVDTVGFAESLLHSPVCDDCGVRVFATCERRFCRACNFDLCRECSATRARHDLEIIEGREKSGERLMEQWHHLDGILQVLATIHCDVALLFCPRGMEKERGVVSRERFVTVLDELVSGREAAVAFYDCVAAFLRDAGRLPKLRAGSDPPAVEAVKVSDLVSSLRICDTEAAEPSMSDIAGLLGSSAATLGSASSGRGLSARPGRG